MKKSHVILGAIIFSIMLTSIIVSLDPAQAFNKKGPTPIPGNLFPHPGTLSNDNTSKHAIGKLHSPQIVDQKD